MAELEIFYDSVENISEFRQNVSGSEVKSQNNLDLIPGFFFSVYRRIKRL